VTAAATTKERMDADIQLCTVKPSHDPKDVHTDTHQAM
jgi:hypothetical protein